MGKYWLKVKLNCSERWDCSQCSKVMQCSDYAMGKSKDCPVSASALPKGNKPNTPEGYHFSKEHQDNRLHAFPDKAFKDERGCKKVIPCSSCVEYFFSCFPK